MSLHKCLRISQPDFEVFAPSWEAGVSGSQSLTKSLSNYDIENVNVPKICDKLYSVLNENHKSIHDVQDEETTQCVIRKSTIPFRASSNIWFGTLKIYQQQVNTLFRLSQDLFSRCCSRNAKHLEGRKRKSSLTSQSFVKRRRITLCESNEKTYFTTSYSQLLDDLEKLTQEPMQKLTPSVSAPITQLQIREITIREISATSDTALDAIDDSGFGEATHEEIAAFFNFVGENPINNSKRFPTKRKSTSGQESPIKRSYMNDVTFEPLNETNCTPCKNVFKSPTLKRSISRTNITIDENKVFENRNLFEEKFVDNNDLLEFTEIKKENSSIIDTIIPTAKKKKMLIIDECIKIDMAEIIEEMKTSELSIKVNRKRTLKAYKSRRNITAFELLTRFNRRSLKLSLSLKQKIYLSREQFERDYLNLLREILKINYDEKLASEIYPKWTCFEDEQLKHHKKQRGNKSRKQKKFTILQEADINNLNEFLNENVENDNYNERQEVPTITNNMKKLKVCIQNDWHPHTVMSKLLNLWRFNNTNKIAAAKLFKLAENQIDRSLGFNSLLNLSKKQFVNLTKFPGSIELENILMGKAVKIILLDNHT